MVAFLFKLGHQFDVSLRKGMIGRGHLFLIFFLYQRECVADNFPLVKYRLAIIVNVVNL